MQKIQINPSKVIQQEDEGQVLGCLINHKNDPEMNDKCSAGVFHFQIISLDSYKLSYAFYKGKFWDGLELGQVGIGTGWIPTVGIGTVRNWDDLELVPF